MMYSIPSNIAEKLIKIFTRKCIIDLVVVKSNISPYMHMWFYDNILKCEVHEDPTIANFQEIIKELEKNVA